MRRLTSRVVAFYVGRATRRRVVRDVQGRLWRWPLIDIPWDEGQPFTPAEGTELEPVPGHSKHVLGLPL
jgi:hypothetical protein